VLQGQANFEEGLLTARGSYRKASGRSSPGSLAIALHFARKDNSTKSSLVMRAASSGGGTLESHLWRLY
jgi:hypothetical protein